MTWWAACGRGGFVGSAVVRNLAARGVRVHPICAPRVLTSVQNLGGLRKRREHKTADLFSRLDHCQVVLNAPGMANPDRGPAVELVDAKYLLGTVICRGTSRPGIDQYVPVTPQSVPRSTPGLTEHESDQFSPCFLSQMLDEQLLLDDGSLPATTSVPWAVRKSLLSVAPASVDGGARATTRSLLSARSHYDAAVLNVPAVQNMIDNTAAAAVCRGSPRKDIHRVGLPPGDGLLVRETSLTVGFNQVQTVSLLSGWALGSVVVPAMGLWSERLPNISRRAKLSSFGQPRGARWMNRKSFTAPDGTNRCRQLNKTLGPSSSVTPCS